MYDEIYQRQGEEEWRRDIANDIARWQQFLYIPGVSVVRDIAMLQQAVEVHAMHDPTEGGVATGWLELAQASVRLSRRILLRAPDRRAHPTSV